MPDGAAHGVGGAQHVVAPEECPVGQRCHGGRDDVVRHVGQLGGEPVGGQPVGGGEQDDVEHLEGRRVQLVERAVDRHGDGEPAGQRDDVGGRGARDVRACRQQGGELPVAAGAQPRGERGGGVGGHPDHVTTARPRPAADARLPAAAQRVWSRAG